MLNSEARISMFNYFCFSTENVNNNSRERDKRIDIKKSSDYKKLNDSTSS